MLEPPADLDANLVRSALAEHWGLNGIEVSYAATGHGSHNWIVTTAGEKTWFVKADRWREADPRAAAYWCAVQLRERGLECVHAPVLDRSGHPRRQIDARWELAVFPYIDGRNPDFADPAERARIAEVVGRLHAHTPSPPTAPRWAPGHLVPELVELLDTCLDRDWTAGPYASRTRALLRAGLPGIRALIRRHGRLADRLSRSDRPWVITHGEPHGGNTMIDGTGEVRLIDCDDLMLAPPERDLWLLLHIGHQRPLATDNSLVLDAYRRSEGTEPPRPEVIELVRADWHLREISAYARIFCEPHEESDDLAAHWRTLTSYLPTTQNWSLEPEAS